MRWLVAPIVAAFLLATAGFVGALARTTDESAALTASTREVPKTTRAAAEDAAAVPIIARLTGRQAASFAELVKALRATTERVASLEDALRDQVAGTADLRQGVSPLLPRLDCSRMLLERLVMTSEQVPRRLREVSDSIKDLSAAQGKSLRHLRSINRKLSALGVVADARGIEAAGPPRAFEIPSDPVRSGSGDSCAGDY